MRTPKCPLCGGEHWSTQACPVKEKVFKRRSRDREAEKKRRDADERIQEKLQELETRNLTPKARYNRRWQLLNAKEYNAYMRKKMREYRAQGKFLSGKKKESAND